MVICAVHAGTWDPLVGNKTLLIHSKSLFHFQLHGLLIPIKFNYTSPWEVCLVFRAILWADLLYIFNIAQDDLKINEK